VVPSLQIFRPKLSLRSVALPCVLHLPLTPPLFDLNILTIFRFMKLFITQCLPPFFHFFSLRSKNFPQHFVLSYPQSTFFIYNEKTSFTPIQTGDKTTITAFNMIINCDVSNCKVRCFQLHACVRSYAHFSNVFTL
jgi:hypothetical protein